MSCLCKNMDPRIDAGSNVTLADVSYVPAELVGDYCSDEEFYGDFIGGDVNNFQQWLVEGISGNRHRALANAVDQRTVEQRLRDAVSTDPLEEVIRLFETEVIGTEHFNRITYSVLVQAGSSGKRNICEYVLSVGADVNYSVEAVSPLSAVCSSKEYNVEDELMDCVELLINHGADVNHLDPYRMTPFMKACHYGHEKIACKLLSYDSIDVNQADNEQWTALHYAVSKGHTEIVKLLMENGAVVDLQDRRGRTPIDLAREKDCRPIELLLLNQNECADEGKTVNDVEQSLLSNESGENFEMRFDKIKELTDGFPGIVVDLLNTISLIEHGGRYSLEKLLERKDLVGLYQFLSVSSEQDLEEVVGFCFSYHRKVILHAIQKFHLIRFDPKLFENFSRNMTLLDGVNFLYNVQYRMLVLKSSLSFVYKSYLESRINNNASDVNIAKKLKKFVVCAHDVYELRKTAVSIIEYCDFLLNLEQRQFSADFIYPRPNRAAVFSRKKLFLFLSVTFVGLVSYLINYFTTSV